MKNRQTLFMILALVVILALAVAISGCVRMDEALRGAWGASTKILQDGRKDAVTEVFNYDYGTCYEKTEKILKILSKASIYSKNKEMIALYYIDPNTTPVGIFFKEIDSAHTELQVSSPGLGAKDAVAKYIFSSPIWSQSE